MKRRNSIVVRALMIFFVAFLLMNYFAIKLSGDIAESSFFKEKKAAYSGISEVMEEQIHEYASAEWVFHYLMIHLDDMELKTEESEELLSQEKAFLTRHGNRPLTEITAKQLDSFPEEDQRLFVQIVYLDLLENMNKLLDQFNISYLSIFATDSSLKEKIFLISADNEKYRRGNRPTDVYVYGTRMTNTPDQITALENHLQNKTEPLEGDADLQGIANLGRGNYYMSGDYVSYYGDLLKVDDYNILTVGTYIYKDSWLELSLEIIILTLVFGFFVFIFSLICLILLYFFILRPIQKVRKSVADYSHTKDTDKVKKELAKIKSKNEIGALSSEFSDMVQEMDDYVDQIRLITAEKERVNAEMDLAADVQAGILPNTFPAFPDQTAFDIYATMNPAKEVGGDFYDFFMTDENHLALVIGDVSGKGMPAALFMVMSKVVIKSRALWGGTPAEILADVNTQLCENNPGNMFVTVWMALIDIRTGAGFAANAGHEHPVLKRAGENYELIEYEHSPLLGMIEGIGIDENEFKLNPGDRLFVYTDGVPEASDVNQQLYGLDRMMESLNEKQEKGLKELLEVIKEDIDNYAGEADQFDDITMLIFEYSG